MPTPTWEYKIHFEFTEESLNALGGEGWEAVGVAQPILSAATGKAGLVVLFKREMQTPSGVGVGRVRGF